MTANPGTPIVNPRGVVNSASLVQQAPVAPGSLISVFGSGLAGGQNYPPNLPWPTTMAGTAVAIQGRFIPLRPPFDHKARPNHSAEEERLAYLEKKIQTKDDVLASCLGGWIQI